MKAFDGGIFRFLDYSFDLDSGVVALRYDLDGTEFLEEFVIPVDGVDFGRIDSEELDRVLFNLHLIVGISYWKMKCPSNIVIESGVLTRTQAHFWNMVYTRGLGQFYFENGIDYRDRVHFPYDDSFDVVEVVGSGELDGNVMVPVGGGKDSIVTAELLKAHGISPLLFAVQDAAAIRITSEEIGGRRIVVGRTISAELVRWNKEEDVFNGHVPISAIWSFVAVLSALVHGQRDVVFSWESSASSGNFEYLGEEINHQWSKSIEWERALQSYLDEFVTRNVRVFSLIRPLSEFHVVKLFAKMERYFPLVSSCNRNFTQKNIGDGVTGVERSYWCGSCPKCAFMFVMFSAWLAHDVVVGIFGQDLFTADSLIETFKELLGIAGHKPFECVGEPGEVIAAFELAFRRGDAEDTFVMKWYADEVRDKVIGVGDIDALISELLEISRDNAIPKDYRSFMDYDVS